MQNVKEKEAPASLGHLAVGTLQRSSGSIEIRAVLVRLQPATKAPRGHPSPRWGAEENGKKEAETGGSG